MATPTYNRHPGRWLVVFVLSIIALFMIICTASSCDCQYHLKRAKKKCGIISQSDTTYVHDTTLVASVQRDTVFHYYQKDTVIVREGRLTMKYFYNTKDSTVYLNGKCDTVFIVKDQPVAINNNTTLKPDADITWRDWVTWGTLVLILFGLAFRRR